MSNMVVRTNVFALNAHRNMATVGRDQQTASNRLSSGFRINSAADDAAGLAISEGMRAQIRGLDQASRNAQDGQSMILTTEGGLEEIGNMLQRVRELLVQSSNDTNTQGQRDMIQQELGQLAQEIGSMQNRVEFNTSRVLAMGPAIDQAITAGVSEIVQDGLRVSDSFALVDANRDAVLEARDLLATLDGTMRFDEMNSRQQNTVLRAFESVQFSGIDTFGPNFVDTNLPMDINGMSRTLMEADAALAEIRGLLAAEEAAWAAVEAGDDIQTTGQALSGLLTLTAGTSADLIFTEVIDDTGPASAAHVTAALLSANQQLSGALGAAVATDATNNMQRVNHIVGMSDNAIRSMLESISISDPLAGNPFEGVGLDAGFIDDVLEAVADYRTALANRENHRNSLLDLVDAGFGTNVAANIAAAGPAQWETNWARGNQASVNAAAAQLAVGAGNAAGTEHYALQRLRNDYYVALNDRGAAASAVNTANNVLSAAMTALGGNGLNVAGPDVFALTGMLSERQSALIDRSATLNEVRFEMMRAGETQFGNVREFAERTTSGNYVAWYQVGANSNQGTMFDFETVSRAVASAGAVVDITVALAAMPDSGAGVGRGIDISPLINEVQASLDDIARVRANLGAVSNRMDFTMRSLDISSENLQDAESRVRNTDVAREMMRFTMANVLQQASVSMLAQANQMPNNLLQLLR